MDAAHLMDHAVVHGRTLAAVAAMSKAEAKQTLDTGLTVTGLVLVGVGSFIAKRKQRGQ
ncbi:hypothetical protein KDL01_00305 [Actinospica durhamensis]|uniref:Uncharacterized protein n=1 Tax=Actinospica durhamensis TaxID=1508375 RepID=A0A941EHP9_9ACTN|nr:hypothetical protein [Actinospica durhamensis]MBR7831677.1 hypothetical protein [Actinospica durhamensis]